MRSGIVLPLSGHGLLFRPQELHDEAVLDNSIESRLITDSVWTDRPSPAIPTATR